MSGNIDQIESREAVNSEISPVFIQEILSCQKKKRRTAKRMAKIERIKAMIESRTYEVPSIDVARAIVKAELFPISED